MKTKRIFALLCTLALTLSLAAPAMAAESQGEYVDLGNGFYMIVTIEQGPMSRAGDTVTGSKSAVIKSGTTEIGKIIVTAEFDISGTTAKATRASISGSGMNGWTYTNGYTTRSSNKATGTGTFSNGSTTVNGSLTLTCSPSGEISV